MLPQSAAVKRFRVLYQPAIKPPQNVLPQPVGSTTPFIWAPLRLALCISFASSLSVFLLSPNSVRNAGTSQVSLVSDLWCQVHILKVQNLHCGLKQVFFFEVTQEEITNSEVMTWGLSGTLNQSLSGQWPLKSKNLSWVENAKTIPLHFKYSLRE